MSASEQPATMRGPWVRTPRLMLLLLLVLATLTGTVLCQDEDAGAPEDHAGDSGDNEIAEELLAAPSTTSAPDASTTSATVDNHTEDFQGSGSRRSFFGSPRMSDIGNDHRTEISETTEETPSDITIMAEREESLDLIIIIIPAVLVVVIIGMIVCCILISRRWNNKTKNKEMRKEDSYLDGSCTEKVPMPMFEDDVPSVLEVEMDELDQWIKKDGENVGDTEQS